VRIRRRLAGSLRCRSENLRDTFCLFSAQPQHSKLNGIDKARLESPIYPIIIASLLLQVLTMRWSKCEFHGVK
jgi:hypothetical protein